MTFSYNKSGILLLATVFLVPLSVSASETLTKEATYYSDVFQGEQTANGDTFDQGVYSAAMCDIPLGQYLYVSKGNTGMVVDLNDRPNCSRFPGIIDLSTEAFRKLAPLSLGRVDGVSVTPMGAAPTDRAKTFLAPDTFSHLSVILTSKIPTILFSGDTIEVSGRVTTSDQYVLLYAQKEGVPPVNKLIKVGKDKSFKGFITLPNATGETVFVVASGNSFDTDKYATISLISPESITYPSIRELRRTKLLPKISYNSSSEPMIRLPNGLYALLEITQGKRTSRTQGTNLLLGNFPLSLGKAAVRITGFGISTPSPLDRSVSYPNLFSGTVLLERSHDTIGGDLVTIQNRNTTANFRFKSPSTYRVRGKYYIIAPNGEVKEISFPKSYLNSDGYLLPEITINGTLSLDMVGTYLLEIVREDGIAFANIPVTRGQAWPIIDPLTDNEVSQIRTDRVLVINSTVNRINAIRKSLSRDALSLDDSLTKLAQAKVDDMIKRGYQGHADPDGNYIDYLAMRLGIDTGGSIGENIGYGTVSDLSLEDGLEESGVHRQNMLNTEWTRVGIGYGVNEGKTYLVHIFSE